MRERFAPGYLLRGELGTVRRLAIVPWRRNQGGWEMNLNDDPAVWGCLLFNAHAPPPKGNFGAPAQAGPRDFHLSRTGGPRQAQPTARCAGGRPRQYGGRRNASRAA